MSGFDPYYKWFGIPPSEQPPDLYRLLGIARFEADLDVIDNASEARMAQLRMYQTGPHVMESQRLLNEVAAARATLIDPSARATYDAKLASTGYDRSLARSPPPVPTVPMHGPPPWSVASSPPAGLSQVPFGTDSFAENPEPRVPSVLVLDVSYSMHGKPIAELNAGLQIYRDELVRDSLASKRVEVAVITFGGSVSLVSDFTTAAAFTPPTLEVNGHTPMGKAIRLALDKVEMRKSDYRSNGIPYYRPWIFLLTDGEPNDEWQSVVPRVKEGEQQQLFSLFAIGVQGANMDILRRIALRNPLQLQGLRFREMFHWLSNSQRSVSRSSPGEQVPLENPAVPGGWASV